MKKISHIFCTLLISSGCAVTFANAIKPVQLTAIRITNLSTKVKLTLHLSRYVPVKTVLKNGNLKIILPETVLKLPSKQSSWRSSALPLVKNLTLKEQQNQVLLQSSAVKATKIITFWQLQPQRLVVELTQDRGILKKELKHNQDKITRSSLIKNNSQIAKKFVVVLDPGHGGKDAGAIGVGKNLEKKVTLAVAKRLKQHLEATGKVKVWLTRTHDINLSKQKRMDFARLHHAQLFISLHADADPARKASGASVFILSANSAHRVAERWLRTRDQHSWFGRLLAHRHHSVRSVLINMAQNAAGESSLKLGQLILKSLANVTKLHASRVKVAAFWVLKAPEIPSLLIEMGFISHPYEGKMLSRINYQEKLAKAIASGIMQYIENNEQS